MRRFTRHSRRRRATWATFAVVTLGLAGLLAVAVFSPLLALRTIVVTGTDRLDVHEVTDAVSGQLETPLALIDFDRLRSELQQFTLIRSYVTETIPPSTLVIHVVERQPVGVIVRGRFFDQVDPAGVVIASSEESHGLPVITALPVDSPAFRAAVGALLAMPESVRTRVLSISAATPNDVRLALVDVGPGVVWGGAESSELKAEVLERLLARPECASVEVIDVSAPLAPICGPG